MIAKTKKHINLCIIMFMVVLMLLSACASPSSSASEISASSLNTSSVSSVPSANVSISGMSSSVSQEVVSPGGALTSVPMPEEPLIFLTEHDISRLDFATHNFEIDKEPYCKTTGWICSIVFSGAYDIEISLGPYGEDESGVWYVGSYAVQNGVISAEVQKVGFEPPPEDEPAVHLTITALWNPDFNGSTAVLTFNRPSSSTEEFDEWFGPMYNLVLSYQLYFSDSR